MDLILLVSRSTVLRYNRYISPKAINVPKTSSLHSTSNNKRQGFQSNEVLDMAWYNNA